MKYEKIWYKARIQIWQKSSIVIGQVDKDLWIIMNTILQPSLVSNDGTRLKFNLGRGKEMIFSRNNFTKEIGDVYLYDSNKNAYEPVDIYK